MTDGGIPLDTLLQAYARGWFPMAEAADDPQVRWVKPHARGVLPLDGFHVPTRLARTVRATPWRVTLDQDFAGVIAACAQSVEGRPETWINGAIRDAYLGLHARGLAHSLEVWDGPALVGGLYGLRMGGAFFGESMFSRARDASKIALVHLVGRLRHAGFVLLDAQFENEHLDQFGAVSMPDADYARRLAAALDASPDLELFLRPLNGTEAVDYARQPTIQAS